MLMMKKKYFFFDYDGTITDPKTMEPVPSCLEALRLLEKNGHFVALATGRAHYKARGVMEKIGLHNMVCAGGAGIVIDDVLRANYPLDLETMKNLVKLMKSKNIGYLVSLDDSQNVYSDNNLFILQAGARQEDTKYIIDPSFDIDKVDQIYKAYISIRPGYEYVIPDLGTTDYLRLQDEYVVIQHNRKQEGIIKMMEMLNAPLEDVVAFGDDRNDVVMCDDRWFSVALGTGPDELKQKASYVTDNSVDDGIYNACKKFGWI